MKQESNSKADRSLIGPAGEHYVLYKLYRRGILASLAPPGTPTTDILVLNPDESIMANLQVKTRTQGLDGGWHMKPRHAEINHNRLFYALVDLEPDAPVTYVVPSSVVAAVLTESFKAWLAAPGRGGRPHSATNTVRRLLPKWNLQVPGFPDGWLDQYEENWDALSRTQ